MAADDPVTKLGKLIAPISSMSEPTIDRFMTHDPITIDRGQPLNTARRMMRTHCIRHLPVVHDGKLVGIVSQRDLFYFDRQADGNQDQIPVGVAMTKSPYAVGPQSPLRQVAAEMSSRRCGSVVVVDGLRVIGLLTAEDGLRALSVVLSEQLYLPS